MALRAVVFKSLMVQGSVKRQVVRVMGKSSGKIRLVLRRRGIRLTIKRKSNELRRGNLFDYYYNS